MQVQIRSLAIGYVDVQNEQFLYSTGGCLCVGGGGQKECFLVFIFLRNVHVYSCYKGL